MAVMYFTTVVWKLLHAPMVICVIANDWICFAIRICFLRLKNLFFILAHRWETPAEGFADVSRHRETPAEGFFVVSRWWETSAEGFFAASRRRADASKGSAGVPEARGSISKGLAGAAGGLGCKVKGFLVLPAVGSRLPFAKIA